MLCTSAMVDTMAPWSHLSHSATERIIVPFTLTAPFFEANGVLLPRSDSYIQWNTSHWRAGCSAAMLFFHQTFLCNYMSKRKFSKITTLPHCCSREFKACLPAFLQNIFPVQHIQSRVRLSISCADVKWFHYLMWKGRLKLLALLIVMFWHTTFEDPLHLFKPISGTIMSESPSLSTRMSGDPKT